MQLWNEQLKTSKNIELDDCWYLISLLLIVHNWIYVCVSIFGDALGEGMISTSSYILVGDFFSWGWRVFLLRTKQ